ncbi:alpha-galactosidase [Anaerosporobacter faecicola]|uniref:alpha-galactosidase n=1 Tax=Anaerosporobacter faecicola TaxID=2718714 RepID=UPI001439AFC6|nr:alpha-galactosidase [Anaerosporobacter faecicola]
MAITYFDDSKSFKLDTVNTTYMIAIVDEEKFIGHVYYGKRVSDQNLNYLLRTEEPPFVPSKNNRDRSSFYDSFPMEYATHGIGDYRESAMKLRTEQGYSAGKLSYVTHTITNGKEKLQGLPATFGDEEDCMSLSIICEEEFTGIQVILHYSVFEKEDVITRDVQLVNKTGKPVFVEKVFSCCLDFDGKYYDMITLHGSWARERHIQRRAVGLGKQGVASIRGESSHQDHPFLALCSKEATEDFGEVYGLNFVYSGNFLAQAEESQFGMTRVVMGIHPEEFRWLLKDGDLFQAPEVVMTYSCKGIGQMTRNFHNMYRRHLIRSKYKNMERPILINNWEATYFNFDKQKLIDIAKEASKLGIEMLVMDDGWFGNRYDDNRALGDWFVNEEKIEGGLKSLVDEVNALGMKFGIWFEPEMISPESQLYKEHPDWAIQIEGKPITLSRNQYVLDISRQEIRDYIYGLVKNILSSANIAYVKWDMNRQLTNLGSKFMNCEQMGEISHRYVLGVYEMMERLTKDFPDLLLENCSGGGARFDAGMLYYSPQIWCSDNTDAIERLEIQRGTSMVYPLSTMGAHVSDCPNHTTGRVTPFMTRGHVALAGTFGYELDVTKISEEDKACIPEQIALYHKYAKLIQSGDYYRIANVAEERYYDCYEVVAADKSEALITYVQVMNVANSHSRRIRIKGLEQDALYEWEENGLVQTGAAYENAGILIPSLWGDYQSILIHLIRK